MSRLLIFVGFAIALVGSTPAKLTIEWYHKYDCALHTPNMMEDEIKYLKSEIDALHALKLDFTSKKATHERAAKSSTISKDNVNYHRGRVRLMTTGVGIVNDHIREIKNHARDVACVTAVYVKNGVCPVGSQCDKRCTTPSSYTNSVLTRAIKYYNELRKKNADFVNLYDRSATQPNQLKFLRTWKEVYKISKLKSERMLCKINAAFLFFCSDG